MWKTFFKYKNQILSNSENYFLNQKRTKKYLKNPQPIWKPLSIKRLYEIKPKKKILKKDQNELNDQEILYRIYFRSIKNYFHQEFTVPGLLGGHNELEVENEKIEQQSLIKENDKENQRIAKLKEDNKTIEEKETLMKNIKLQLKKNEEYELKKNEAINKILTELQRYPTYITNDKLVSAIENAIDNPTSYDYAIDLKGQIVFNEKLHPYALRPSDEPDSDNITDDFIEKNQVVKLKQRRIYK